MFPHLSVDNPSANVDCAAQNLSRIVKINVNWKQTFIANILANCSGKQCNTALLGQTHFGVQRILGQNREIDHKVRQ
jgi:hypothetical protein